MWTWSGSLMLDVVFAAMFLIVLLMGVSIYLVRFKKKYELHKRIQLTLATVLLLAVTAFEVEMRFFTDWEDLAKVSPYFDADNPWTCPVGISLIIHLCFAIPVLPIWGFVIIQGLRRFPSPAAPNEYSPKHIFWARIAAVNMTMTAITGWVFYSMAFILK